MYKAKIFLYCSMLLILQGFFCPMKLNAETDQKALCANDALKLSDSEIKECEQQTLAGKPDPAFRLYSYYVSYLNKFLPSQKWLLLAVKLKQPTAIYNFKFFIEDKKHINELIPEKVFTLSDSEIKTLSEKAQNGAGDAAFWLFLYYRFAKNDIKTAEVWRRFSNEHGIALADQSYWDDEQDGPTKWQGYSWPKENK